MIVVIDTSLSQRIAHILEAAFAPAHHIVHVLNISGKHNADAEVSEYLQANMPSVFVSVDLDTIGQPHRMAALAEMKCSTVLLTSQWMDMPYAEQAASLLAIFPRLVNRLGALTGTATLQVTPPPNPHIRKLR